MTRLLGRTILVVEDADDVREGICEILGDEGYRAIEACNGLEALERLRADGRPCVILLDLMMPRMNGWQFLDAMREEEHADVPVVIVTANAPAAPAGYRVVPKPINVDELLAAVSYHCACGQ